MSQKKIVPGSDIEANLKSLTKTRTAGDPDNEQVVFTDLTPTRMEQELAILETPASDDLIRQWMDEQKLRLRKIRKVESLASLLIVHAARPLWSALVVVARSSLCESRSISSAIRLWMCSWVRTR